MFKPKSIYFEKNIENYELGKELLEKYREVPKIEIENHNNIEEMRKRSNKEFVDMKRNLIIGVRKTHKFVENHKTSDYLVPYTSSGCTASCMYCYLVCNYNKCSYLRLFVNREEMLDKIIRTAKNFEKELTFEIGSNSDLILENTITNNLVWTIENFKSTKKGRLTFPTKFDMVDNILDLNHKGKVTIRMSVNPDYIINRVEFGTSRLDGRIEAINNYVHTKINEEAFPNSINLYNKEIMKGSGRGKYRYKEEIKKDGEIFLREQMNKYFPNNKIEYIV